jgi:hypothetical protein
MREIAWNSKEALSRERRWEVLWEMWYGVPIAPLVSRYGLKIYRPARKL